MAKTQSTFEVGLCLNHSLSKLQGVLITVDKREYE